MQSAVVGGWCDGDTKKLREVLVVEEGTAWGNIMMVAIVVVGDGSNDGDNCAGTKERDCREREI